MKRFVMLAGTLALTVVVAGSALAQGGQGQGQRRQGGGQGRGGGFGQGGRFGQGGMFGGGIQMLRLPAVQKELAMSDAQIGMLDAKQDEVQAANREAMEAAGGFQALRDMNEADRAKLAEKRQEIVSKAVASILTGPDQLKRYKQLELQQAGPMAAARKDVAEALKLTPEQRTQITAIQTQLNEQRGQLMRESFQGGGQPDPAAIQAAMQKGQALQKTANEKVLALFTDAQKASWKEMTGAPFKFPEPQRRPGV